MNHLKELTKDIWFPFLILLVIIAIFFIIGGISIKEGLVGSFGGALVGVILGFVAEMMREGIKEFQSRMRDKKIYLSLLKEDAKNTHHSMWLYTRLIKDPNVPNEIKNHLPAEFDLHYWSQLSKESNFLRFGSEKPFDKIFQIMWNFEKINEQIRLAKSGSPQAFQFAHAFYRLAIEDEVTKKLLLCFMTELDIQKLENDWLRTAQEKIKGSKPINEAPITKPAD